MVEDGWKSRIVDHGMVSPSDLMANPLNFRRHPDLQQVAMAEVLGRIGWVSEIIVNRTTGHILDGHLRVELALDQQVDQVPVKYVELSESEERMVLATFDPISDMAVHDNRVLADLITGIDVPMEIFADIDLSGPVPDAPDDPDESMEPPADPVTVPGDLWIMGRHRLVCGDATDPDAVALLMDGGKGHMAFTDPPYGVDYSGGIQFTPKGVKHGARERLQQDHRGTDIYDRAIPVLSGIVDGPCYVWYPSVTGETVYRAIRAAGGTISSLICWVKDGGYAAMNAQYKQRHEVCLYWKPKGAGSRWIGPTTENTVWEISKDGRNTYHPTQKPVELALRAIRNHDAPVVVDLFAGSGSTIIACEDAGRSARAMDIDPGYCDVMVARWEAHTGKKAARVRAGE